MIDDPMMRLRLQQVAAYRDLCKNVRRSGRGNVFFAMLMLFLAYITFQPGAGIPFLYLLYIGLALGELAVGLFKFLHPSAEGILLDGLVLLIFAAFNFGNVAVRMQAGLGVTPVSLIFGIFMLMQAVGRFKLYGQLRKLFAERPSPELIAWVDDLIRDIGSADPATDETAVDLRTTPALRAKLLGPTAFFVDVRGGTLWTAAPTDFEIRRHREDRGTGLRKARLIMFDTDYPEFTITDASWENYVKWRDANVQQAGNA